MTKTRGWVRNNLFIAENTICILCVPDYQYTAIAQQLQLILGNSRRRMLELAARPLCVTTVSKLNALVPAKP